MALSKSSLICQFRLVEDLPKQNADLIRMKRGQKDPHRNTFQVGGYETEGVRVIEEVSYRVTPDQVNNREKNY